jgi:protein FrlC
MKFSLSTFVYFRFPLAESIRRTAALGYEAVEIWGGRPHAFCDDMDDARVSDTKKLIVDCGMEISNFIPAQFRYPVNIAIHDDAIRQRSVDYLKKSINVACALGSPFASVCPGFSIYPQTPSQAWDTLRKSLAQLADFAKDMPLIVLLEPAHRMESDLVLTVADGIKMVQELDGRIGLLPDIGHLQVNRESLQDVVDRLAGIPCHWHIDDNCGNSDDHLVPGEGIIDYRGFLHDLISAGYAGSLAVELGYPYIADPDTAARQSIQHLRALMEEIPT